MNDKEFIVYLCEQLWDLVTDGNTPNIDRIIDELNNRGIDPDEIFVY